MADPYCLAMVLCDAVHRDAATGKHTLLGTFSTFSAREFPAKLQFFTYFAITDGMGPTTVKLRLVDAESLLTDQEETVFEFKVDVDLESPLMVLESFVGVECTVNRPGLYHCELFAGTSLLMSRRLVVRKIDTETSAEDSDND